MTTLRNRLNVEGLAVITVVAVAWQASIAVGLLNLDYVPAPSAIIRAVLDALRNGSLLGDLGHTLSTTLVATAIAIAIGASIGGLLGSAEWARTWTMSSVDFFRTIPVTALVPVALLVWGPSTTAEVVVAAYAAVWPVIINTTAAVQAVPHRLKDVARTFHMSRGDYWRKVALPAAIPGILVGARLSLVLALVLSIVAEMLINPRGLGWGLVQARNSVQAEQLWAYTAVAGALAVALNTALTRLVQVAMPGASPAAIGREAAS